MPLKEFIEKKSAQLQKIETLNKTFWWNLATTGDEQFKHQYEVTQVEMRRLFSSKKEYELLQTLNDPDPLLTRQKNLMLYEYQENQLPIDKISEIVKLEAEIEAIYTNYRPVVNGSPISNNDLKEIFTKSRNSKEREEAWKASKLIGEQVKTLVLKLVNLRNAAAKEVGFPDYYSMRLKFQELDQKRLFDLLQELDKTTQPLWKTYKATLDQNLAERCHIRPTELMPWHYSDPFFQEAPDEELQLDGLFKGKDLVPISRTFYESIGLPVNDILDRSDLYERKHKNQHAFCICIDRMQDVRTLCNLRENEYWMSTLLHELGHAVYDKYVDQKLPYLLRTYAHISSTEAIAMLFGRFSKNEHFLNLFCGVKSAEAQRISEPAKKQIAISLLIFARWVLVMTHFERAMYQQPNSDLNKLWWDLVEKYQWVKPVPGRNKPDWAAKLHLACAPVYYQNYILGEMTASQLLAHLKKGLAEPHLLYTTKKTGDWLRERFFKLGATMPWEDTLKHATGESLTPSYFVKDIAL